jgi:hypothetical protein
VNNSLCVVPSLKHNIYISYFTFLLDHTQSILRYLLLYLFDVGLSRSGCILSDAHWWRKISYLPTTGLVSCGEIHPHNNESYHHYMIAFKILIVFFYFLHRRCCAGLAVVFSPLVSLIQDQVDAMSATGIRAVFITSTQDEAEVASIYNVRLICWTCISYNIHTRLYNIIITMWL